MIGSLHADNSFPMIKTESIFRVWMIRPPTKKVVMNNIDAEIISIHMS